MLFPHERVIVELDSWNFHRDRGAFESDRERDAATLAADHVTVRMTWARIHEDPEREAALYRRLSLTHPIILTMYACVVASVFIGVLKL